MKIFLYVINLQTYIVEYRNYTELRISWLLKMQPALWYLKGIVLLYKIEQYGKKGWTTPD